MERLKKKELQQLRQQHQLKIKNQRNALQNILKSDESLAITLSYAQNQLQFGNLQGLAQYSPIYISRLVFDQQLREIKKLFQGLPDQQSKIQHFMVIMLKVMKFPFEKCPLYLVGLKDMFYQIVEEGQESFTFAKLQKYILGELVTIKQQAQNTQFQVQMRQYKKQDYLLHDNGIIRMRYSKDLKMVMSLDNRAHNIKIYDQQMKNVSKFSPKKQKHGNKFPFILDFDYSEIGVRLGMVLSDETICTVHLGNLLSKSQAEFDSKEMNELVFTMPCKMKLIFFIQMINKWFTVPQEGTGAYLFDMERVRTQPEKVKSKPKLQQSDHPVRFVLQVVQLSCVCVVTGNQINFYNQSFTALKYGRFSHHQQILHLRYCEQKNQFYLSGLERSITMFTIGRNNQPTGIKTLSINRNITDFQVFPHFDTIVIADQMHDLRLMHEPTKTVYQQTSYAHVVKTKNQKLTLIKMSKTDFAVFQTYLLVMSQEKIAIQMDIQYNFLPYCHFDKKKEEFYMSVNNQIVAFSLSSGQIRKHYSSDTALLQNHHCFFLAPKTPLFIIDHYKDLYEVYFKNIQLQGENFSYRKKVNVENIVSCFYDPQMHHVMVLSHQFLNIIRNDGGNNFTTINSLILEGFGNIIAGTFCQHSKIITFMTKQQIIYQMHNYYLGVQKSYQFVFPRPEVQEEQGVIQVLQYDHNYELFIILSNKSEVYFYSKANGVQLYFDILENMPFKLKNLKFAKMTYQLFEQKKGHFEPYILLKDDTGFIVQFALGKILQKHGFVKNIDFQIPKAMYKDSHTVKNQLIPFQLVHLSNSKELKMSYEEMGLMKAHEKAIAIAMVIKVQIMVLLTISIDGYIRLWNQKYSCLFSLKIPTLLKITWNMGQIETIKNKKSIQELLLIFKSHFHKNEEKPSPLRLYRHSKELKSHASRQQYKVNYHQPLKIEIQNKQLQEIIMKPDYYTQKSFRSRGHQTQQQFYHTQKVYPHPWRENKEFKKIYNKALSLPKAQVKIPHELLTMRTSLDMTERVKILPNYQQAERILPQLSMYEMEKKSIQQNPEQSIEEQEQTFQSCLFVKSGRRKKKINEFDEIDKEFKKKQMLLTAKKWVPKKRKEHKNSSTQIKYDFLGVTSDRKVDPIKAIQKLFEAHNKQCQQTKKGRMIRVPKINLNRDFY